MSRTPLLNGLPTAMHLFLRAHSVYFDAHLKATLFRGAGSGTFMSSGLEGGYINVGNKRLNERINE